MAHLLHTRKGSLMTVPQPWNINKHHNVKKYPMKMNRLLLLH